MRSSDWKIIWDPAGASPLVLLDYDDLMDSEIRLPREQLTAVGKSDFDLRVTTISRRNVKRRIEFSVRRPHVTDVQAWAAALDALSSAPWGIKAPMSIQPRSGEARLFTAALLSSRHKPSFEDGFVESIHHYAFRLSPVL